MSSSLTAQIQKLVEDFVTDETQIYAVSQILPIFRAAADEERYDQVIRNVTYALEQMSQRNPQTLVKATDIWDLYNTFVTLNPNTKFATIFANLLPSELKGQQKSAQDMRLGYNDSIYSSNQQIEDFGTIDKESFRNVTGSLSDDTSMLQLNFGSETIQKGENIVKAELESLGADNVKVTIQTGNEHFMLCMSNFSKDGTKVKAGIPVEVVEKQVLLPSILVAHNKTYPFTVNGISQLMLTQVAQDVEVNNKKRVEAHLDQIRIDNRRDDPSRLLSKEAKNTFEVDEYELPTVEAKMPEELLDVETILTNAILQKESKYNQSMIEKGRQVVSTELTSLGMSEHRIAFAGDYSNGLIYNVSILDNRQKLYVQIPVEVRQSQALIPTTFISKDAVLSNPETKFYSFDNSGFQKFAKEDNTMVDTIRYDGSLLTLSYNELLKVIHAATLKGEHEIAREALNLVQDKFGGDAHTKALENYQLWIEGTSEDNSIKCGGCDFYLPKGGKKINGKVAVASVHGEDHCLLLKTACRKVTKDETGICTKSSVYFDRLRDDNYKGEIITSQIKLT